MAAALPLRPDFCAADLKVLARASNDANQTRRLLALASIYDGGFHNIGKKMNEPLQLEGLANVMWSI